MPTPPSPSPKDANQVLKYAFDDAAGALRTNATLVADSVALMIDAADDNIAIADASSGYKMSVNSDGTANVRAVVSSSALPTGAATETTVSAINGKLNSLGQKASAASVPVVIASDQSSVVANPTAFAVQTDQASSSVLYVGKANPGSLTSAASWQIKRITSTSTTLSIQYAAGSSAFTNIWDNRASLSYS